MGPGKRHLPPAAVVLHLEAVSRLDVAEEFLAGKHVGARRQWSQPRDRDQLLLLHHHALLARSPCSTTLLFDPFGHGIADAHRALFEADNLGGVPRAFVALRDPLAFNHLAETQPQRRVAPIVELGTNGRLLLLLLRYPFFLRKARGLRWVLELGGSAWHA